MPNVVVNNRSLQQIAQAIRNKNQTIITYKPHEMASAIEALPVGVIEVATSEEMDANLTSGLAGASYLYIGTTDSKYINGRIYVIRYSAEPIVHTISFNGDITGKYMANSELVEVSTDVPINLTAFINGEADMTVRTEPGEDPEVYTGSVIAVTEMSE